LIVVPRVFQSGERYPTNAHKQFLLCLLIPLHVSASRCHLQRVKISLFISYSRLSAFRVGVGYCSSGVPICCDILKNIAQPVRPQMTIWLMCIACRIPKATNTHTLRLCNTHSFSIAKVGARTRLSVMLHVHCLSCAIYRHLALCEDDT
jgi:hypothetical protein